MKKIDLEQFDSFCIMFQKKYGVHPGHLLLSLGERFRKGSNFSIYSWVPNGEFFREAERKFLNAKTKKGETDDPS